MGVKNLNQSTTFRASPQAVYEALIDPRKHAAFSGGRARLTAKVGGRFSHYDDSLTGVVVHLERNRRIVLAWRASGWPKGHYSIAQFVIRKVPGGSRLEFSQFGIPESDFEDISSGWKLYYWQPMKEYLEG